MQANKIIALLELEHAAIAGIASGATLAHALEKIVAGMEAQSGDEMQACILLLDEQDRFSAPIGPHLPPAFGAVLAGGDTGPRTHPFGAAAFSGAPVFSSDIAQDQAWTQGRKDALVHGFRACWAAPVFGARGRILGVLGMLFHASKHPTQLETELMNVAARISAHTIERYLSEKSISDSEEHLRHAFELNAQVLWTAHADGKLDYLARRWRDWTGTSGLGGSWGEALHPDDLAQTQAAWRHAVASGEPYDIEHRVRLQNGQYHWMRTRALCRRNEQGEVVKWYGSTEDINAYRAARAALLQSEAELHSQAEAMPNQAVATGLEDEIEFRLHSEQALLQAQQLESLGKLTGGVAHDFNNILHIISGNLQLLQLALADNPLAMKRLESSASAVERGAKLSSQLLAFARRQPLKPLVTDLGALLRGMDELVRRAIGETIVTEIMVGDDLWHTLVDPNQMENAVLNMALNARDAMNGSGTLSFALSNAILDETYARRHPGVQAGSYVLLEIADTGHGMERDVIEQIFDPFFSTRKEGEGAGLGLSMAYGFIHQSGGHIKVYSKAGQGSTFKLYLPRSFESLVAKPPSQDGPVLGGTETILVVEDDLQVQTTVVDMLRGLGYQVLKASDAQSAMTVIKSGVAIDVLFTDVMMPGELRSPELARQAKALLPRLQVLFTSGYTQNAIMHNGRLDPGIELLSKPYRREDLARRLRHLLAGRQPAAPAQVPPAGGRQILLVEDNPDAREMTTELLHMLGHTVCVATSAEEALGLLEMDGLEVLMTDISLPQMSGIELAKRVRQAWPHLDIIFSTGHERSNTLIKDDAAKFLPKPFSIEQLEAVFK